MRGPLSFPARTCGPLLLVLLACRALAAPPAPLADALRRASNTGRVLVVVAHPGDEPFPAIAALVHRRGVRVAVFAATRGESGSHGGGADPRGVRRTADALAARRTDGAEQLFGRVYDGGEAATVEETLARWDGEAALGDLVRAVRRVRPDVMLVGSSSGAPSHAAVVALARQAFHAAADPARFPELGRAWRVTQLDQVDGAGAVVLADASGRATRFRVLETTRPRALDGDPLDGVDMSLPGLLRTVSVTQAEALRNGLQTVALRLSAAGAAADGGRGERAVPALRTALEALRYWRERVAVLPAGDARSELVARLDEREVLIEEALARAIGLELTAVADDATLTAGQTFGVLVSLRNGSPDTLRVERVELASGGRWGVQGGFAPGLEVAPGASVAARVLVTVAADAVASAPYWHPEAGRARVALLQPALEGLPFAGPELLVRAQYATGGTGARLETQVLADVSGQRVPIAVLPDVTFAPAVTVTVPARAGKPSAFDAEFTVADHTPRGGAVRVALDLPAGWRAEPSEVSLSLPGNGQARTARVRLTPPPRLPPGRYEVPLVATRGERRYADSLQTVAAAPHGVLERARLVVVAAARP